MAFTGGSRYCRAADGNEPQAKQLLAEVTDPSVFREAGQDPANNTQHHPSRLIARILDTW